MCAVRHVSRSGFDAWPRRQPSSRTQANQRRIARMRVLHQQTREASGARKMWPLFTREGLVCGRPRVARRRRRARRTVQVRQHETPAIPNRLNQQCAVSAKNRVGAGNLPCVPPRTGWLTVAVLLALYSRRVVGWARRPRQTLSVGVEAWWRAWPRRRPASGLVHHSDHGHQYRAGLDRTGLARRGGVLSMRRKGNCYDTAPVERGFSSLKNEFVRHRQFQSQAAARDALAGYIERC
jgi:putative transposase